MTEPVVETGAPVARSQVHWWSLTIVGLLSIAFGAVLLIWPTVSLLVFAVLIGVWLLVIGLMRIIGTFTHREGHTVGHQVFSVVLGVLFVIAGVVCLRHLVVGLGLLVALIALQWLLTGVLDLIVAAAAPRSDRVWLIITGVLSLVLGIAFLVMPVFALGFFVLFAGISAIVLGIVQVASAFQLRRQAAIAPA